MIVVGWNHRLRGGVHDFMNIAEFTIIIIVNF